MLILPFHSVGQYHFFDFEEGRVEVAITSGCPGTEISHLAIFVPPYYTLTSYLPSHSITDIVEKAYLQCERENDVTVPARTVIVSVLGIVLDLRHPRGEQSDGALSRVPDHEVQRGIPTRTEMSEVVCHHHAGVKDVTVLNMHGLRDVVDHGLPFTQGEGRGLVPGLDHEVLKRREILS
ncbi:hypothetical protein Y032_0062g3377 [Ancylostoma ceylanicum]|uniref:Uncharacterized protein n=1 Tax=Ancylostoma ceylanicum TaxID=53326 RepID=A0A016U3F9_9BILA|nr:hypothetical protein Y032_0062g3377 [Ancylostoma ceylanicum]